MQVTKFLNVDLDFRTRSGLEELLEAFGSSVIVMNRDDNGSATVEISSSRKLQSIDDAILAFCSIVDKLSPRVRAIWDQCDVRSMNVGIQAGITPHAKEFPISNMLLSLLLSINAEIVITVYAVND